jgi:uncharacterized protein (DUF608 family)
MLTKGDYSMAGTEKLHIRDFFTMSGSEISESYVKNKMVVHFQGMSKTLQFPQTIALMGAPTLSIGISPEGLYNRLNNAGRLILLYHNGLQLGSAPFIRVGEKKHTMLTTRNPRLVEGPEDVPALKNYYHSPVSEDQVSISLATPLAEMTFELEDVTVTRRMISPFLSGNIQTLIPAGVEEFIITNKTGEARQISLVLPRPSLVNLQEKELKPLDQDTVYACSTPVKGHVHKEFTQDGFCGVVMGSKECEDRMVIAVPQIDGAKIDIQPYFCLNRLKQDLLLNKDGTFFEKRDAIPNQDYGAAISVTLTLEPGATATIPFAVVLDFPVQWYNDGATFDRKYIKYFDNEETRALEMTKIALENYPKWLERTLDLQNRIYQQIRKSPSYKDDREGALRVARLIFNEFSFPISNAAVWVEDDEGERARFLECFDYSYLDPSDVEWYSMVLLFLFPEIEEELCQSFINSILAEDTSKRFYHHHASFPDRRQHFLDHPEAYEGVSLTQIYDQFKVKGSVAHDLAALNKGHPLRNVSDYAWYNSNYWIDLFPKLAIRVLRNIRFTGKMEFLEKNWETLKFGYDYLQKLDLDGDGIPEGYPNDVKNTFDNLPLFGLDAYDLTIFMGGCKAMSIMAELMNDQAAKEKYDKHFATAAEYLDKMWREAENKNGLKLEYYVTCYDPKTGKINTDTWLNQLDAIWALLSIGEEPFIPEERIKKILKTLYENNRTTTGWCMTRTEDGEPVESDQGKDVYTTSNYVFAQLLDYYGLVEESKDVYNAMDKVIFRHGNTLISPDNIRAEMEQEDGETEPMYHYIVAGYPRPGAVMTHLVLTYIKELKDKGVKVEPGHLESYAEDLMK